MDNFSVSASESAQLNNLVAAFISDSPVYGEVVFGSCLPDENRLDFASWFFKPAHYEILKSSGFKTALLTFLDTLILSRSALNPSCREGVVTLSPTASTIQWLGHGEADKLIAHKKSLEG